MRMLTKWIIVCMFLLRGVASAEELSEGKFVFAAPALFGSTEGKARGKLCELEVTEGGYQLVFLNNPLSRGSRIVFSLKGDRIVFDESHMPSTEIGRTITGEGRLQDAQTASGKLTVSMGSVGFLLAKRKSSDWSLRPATRAEVLDNFSDGLKMAEKLIWSNRAIERPTRENAIKALNSVVGYGFIRKDIPELKRMLESGELNYKDGKFFFRQTLPVDVASLGLSISTNVFTERIYLGDKVNAAQNVTMQVIIVSAPVASTASPPVGDVPDPPQPVVERTLAKSAEVEPIPEPQETPKKGAVLPLPLLTVALGLVTCQSGCS